MTELFFPTASHRVTNAVEVWCFGASTGNWALKGPARDQCEAHNPGVTSRMEALLDSYRIQRLFLPSPHRFNAELAEPDDLKAAWVPGRLFRGAEAEGVALERIGDACAIASADCPTIIIRNPRTGLVAVAHAGRESLYDRARLFSQAPPRTHASVVDALVERLAPDPRDVPRLECLVVCGIGMRSFFHDGLHPEHGPNNRILCEHLKLEEPSSVASGCISLARVIAGQFAKQGVPRGNIARDDVDTCADLEKNGKPRWHSRRRDGDAAGRNLVLVIRRA